jgi:hypothetical protein
MIVEAGHKKSGDDIINRSCVTTFGSGFTAAIHRRRLEGGYLG